MTAEPPIRATLFADIEGVSIAYQACDGGAHDPVRGSRIGFETRGNHAPEGGPDKWRLCRALAD